MFGNKSNSDSDDQWKKKYFESLRELEDREQRWLEIEKLLRRGVSRLTLLADGRNSLLDRHLEKLRNSVRSEKNTSRLQTMLDEVIELGTSLQKSSAEPAEQPEPSSVLKDLISALQLPAAFEKERSQLILKLDNTQSATSEQQHVKVAASLLARAMKAVSEGPKEEKPGLLKNLFNRDSKAEVAVTDSLSDLVSLLNDFLTQLVMPQPQLRSLNAIKSDVARINNKQQLDKQVKELARLVSKTMQQEDNSDVESIPVNEVLMQLLERLEFPLDMTQQVSELQKELEHDLREDEVTPVITKLAEMAMQVRRTIEKEKNEIEAFLKQMMDRLQDIETDLEGTMHLQREAFQSGRDLGDAVRVHVNDIRTTMRDADDLETLKSTVQHRLQSIQEHMDEYKTREEEREQTMQEKINEMQDKLESMESEANELRRQIIEEHRAALQDALTEIPNRLAFNERMEQEYKRWQRYKKPLSVIIWDVDDFKNINDTYGHKAGDRVLRTVAQVLQDHIRETDFLARYGGEEFITLLPETDLESAKQVADKLCRSVEACDFHHGDQPVRITVSGGVAEFTGNDDTDSIVQRADGCLYAAKRAGKNRCLTDNKAA